MYRPIYGEMAVQTGPDSVLSTMREHRFLKGAMSGFSPLWPHVAPVDCNPYGQ